MTLRSSSNSMLRLPIEARLRSALEGEIGEDCTAKSGRPEAPCGHALLGRFLPDHWPEPSGSGPFQAKQKRRSAWLRALCERGLVQGCVIGAPFGAAAWGGAVWLAVTFGCAVATLAISLVLASWLAVFYLASRIGGA